MKCIICQSSDIRTQSVSEEIHQGTDIIQVQIEVPVCNACGERYYDRKTMRELEELRIRLRNDTSKLSEIGKVLSYHK